METKICKACANPKSLEDFNRHSKGKQGRQSICKPCDCLRSKKWRQENPEKAAAHARNWAAHSQNWRRENPGKAVAQALAGRRKRLYGLTDDQYKQMRLSQKRLCAICKNPFLKTPQVDHCHKTRKIRGLLCQSCNIGLGGFKDSIDFLKEAMYYLSK